MSSGETIDARNLRDETRRAEEKGGKIVITFVEIPLDSIKSTKVEIDPDIMEEITIGRAPDNMVVVPDMTVSRHHAVLSIGERGEMILKDLSSKNGTYMMINGAFSKIEKQEVYDGALIKLGLYTIIKINRQPRVTPP